MKKIVIYAPDKTRDDLDRAILQGRIDHDTALSRSEVVVAIIESVDVSRFVTKLAKAAK